MGKIDIALVYGAQRAEPKGGWRPRVVLNGQERIGPWGRGLDRDEAEAQARALAEEEAARYAGDWTITLERSTDA